MISSCATDRDVGVKVEQDEQDKSERESDPDVLRLELPKRHDPAPTPSRCPGLARHGKCHALFMDVWVESSPISHTRRRDDGDRHAVV